MHRVISLPRSAGLCPKLMFTTLRACFSFVLPIARARVVAAFVWSDRRCRQCRRSRRLQEHDRRAFTTDQVLVLPVLLLILYGASPLSTALSTELREFLRLRDAKAPSARWRFFRHLHALSLQAIPSGRPAAFSRDIERGTRSISSLISLYTLYSILPTSSRSTRARRPLVKYDWLCPDHHRLLVTHRIHGRSVTGIDIRRNQNESDSAANTRAVDSPLNYEMSGINNEAYARPATTSRCLRWEDRRDRETDNAVGAQPGSTDHRARRHAMMWRAASGVVDGRMTTGDPVLVTPSWIQLYIPLNFLASSDREIRRRRCCGHRAHVQPA